MTPILEERIERSTAEGEVAIEYWLLMASPHNVNNLWSNSWTCHWSLPHLNLHLVSKGWMVYCAVNNKANAIFITETDLIWDIPASCCWGTARYRILDTVHILRLLIVLHSYNTGRRQIWSICHLTKDIILVAVISSTGLINITRVSLTLWGTWHPRSRASNHTTCPRIKVLLSV